VLGYSFLFHGYNNNIRDYYTQSLGFLIISIMFISPLIITTAIKIDRTAIVKNLTSLNFSLGLLNFK